MEIEERNREIIGKNKYILNTRLNNVRAELHKLDCLMEQQEKINVSEYNKIREEITKSLNGIESIING